jgi:hypothetical protein
MKKILLLMSIMVATNAVAQSKDYLLSLDGIGSLKLGMPLAELNKLLHTKVTLKVIDIDSVRLTETVNAKYKGIDVEIDLIKWPDETIVVDGISTRSTLCKTKSGIGIGATKLQIIAAYEGYYIDARPVYVYEGDDKPKKSRTKSTITIKEDEEGFAIVFNLLNKKVVSFSVIPIFDDEEG